MSISKLTIFATLLCCVLSGSAQQRYDLSHFSGLKSEGAIPDDLRKGLGQLYAEDKQRVRDYNNGKLRNRDRVLESSYYINRLTANGRILYGDPVTHMIEGIADMLLRDYPDLRKELRFYTVKSSSVNAFATGQGMIFVNLGLVAAAQSEDQLAFVISHEIIHYLRNHNTEMLLRKKPNTNNLEVQLNDFLKYHNRSHEMEMEADSLGLVMFYQKSPYRKDAVAEVFDMLSRADQPWGTYAFDTTFFNTPYYQLSTDHFLKQVAEFVPNDSTDDSKSSHPNISKRRQAATSIMRGHSWGKASFVTMSQDEFGYIRQLAQMECIRQELIYADFVQAFYNSYAFLKEHPGNVFCQESMAHALYAMAKYKTTNNSSQIVGDYNDYSGEIQQCYYLFRKLSKSEISVLALRAMWRAHQQNPDKQVLTDACRDLVQTLNSSCDLSPTAFHTTFDTASNQNQQSAADTNDKYARFRQKQQDVATRNPLRYALTDMLMADNSLAQFMADCIGDATSQPQTREKNVFVYAPSYLVLDNKEETAVRYKESYDLEQKLVSKIETAAQASGLNVVDFSDAAMRNQNEARFYNDFVTLNEWTNEFWQSKGNVERRLSLQPQMDSLRLRYGADMLSLNMVGNWEEHSFPLGTLLFYTILYPIAPVAYLNVARRQELTATQNLLIDTRNGSVISRAETRNDIYDSKPIVTNFIYRNFHRGLQATAPTGFLGRRMIVSAEAGLHFSPLNALLEFNPYSGFRMRGGLGLEYVVAEKGSVHLSANFGKSQFFIANGRDPNLLLFDNGKSRFNADLTNLALTYRRYIGRDISALVGAYIGFGPSYHHTSLMPYDENVVHNKVDSTYHRFGLQFQVGYHHMLSTRLVLDLGFRYTAIMALPFEYDNMDDYMYEHRDETAAINIRRNFNANLWYENMMTFHIALGFLPF